MFKHSTPVPRSYKLAGKILQEVKENGANLKALLYQEKNKHFPIQSIHALTFEAIKHEKQLNDLIVKSKLLINEKRLNPWLARILITELLWGKQQFKSESKPEKIVKEYQNKFEEILQSSHSSESINNDPVKEVCKPRYIRINTLRIDLADAVRHYQDEGWHLIRCTSKSYDDYLKQLENLTEDTFIADFHVKVVFAFASNTQFHNDHLYLNNDIFLQDKATTLAAFILAPTPGSTVLDMCAAPGMKTTHLAAVMKNEGTIYAIEQNVERYKVLCQFIESSGATCVKPINADVAKITKIDCPNVDYVLLDPSCSGSGISRVEGNDTNFDLDSGRVQKLASFQAKLLRHALNEFRTAKRIVYSTCSLYPQENESVVEDVLRNHKGCFKLVSAKEILKDQWNNFGDAEFKDIGEKCLYAVPSKDYTCGFFIAVFEYDETKTPKEIKTSDKSSAIETGENKKSYISDLKNLVNTLDAFPNKIDKRKLKIQACQDIELDSASIEVGMETIPLIDKNRDVSQLDSMENSKGKRQKFEVDEPFEKKKKIKYEEGRDDAEHNISKKTRSKREIISIGAECEGFVDDGKIAEKKKKRKDVTNISTNPEDDDCVIADDTVLNPYQGKKNKKKKENAVETEINKVEATEEKKQKRKRETSECSLEEVNEKANQKKSKRKKGIEVMEMEHVNITEKSLDESVSEKVKKLKTTNESTENIEKQSKKEKKSKANKENTAIAVENSEIINDAHGSKKIKKLDDVVIDLDEYCKKEKKSSNSIENVCEVTLEEGTEIKKKSKKKKLLDTDDIDSEEKKIQLSVKKSKSKQKDTQTEKKSENKEITVENLEINESRGLNKNKKSDQDIVIDVDEYCKKEKKKKKSSKDVYEVNDEAVDVECVKKSKKNKLLDSEVSSKKSKSAQKDEKTHEYDAVEVEDVTAKEKKKKKKKIPNNDQSVD